MVEPLQISKMESFATMHSILDASRVQATPLDLEKLHNL